MNKFLTDIKVSFGSATALYRIMAVNAAVYLIIQLIRLICFFAASDFSVVFFVREWFALPAGIDALMYKPWTLFTYMFMHVDFMHIFFNLLIFYWTGRLFTEYLGNARLWATYILGGLTGGVLYILIYNLFPVFGNVISDATLNGASAGVIAVMVAIATLLPDYTVQLLLFGPVKLKYIAIFSIVLYAISIPDGNAGGNIAHLGGAFFGFIMVKQLRSGRDLTAWLVKIGAGRKKARMRVVETKKRGETDEDFHDRKKSRQEVIDQILDKISQSGYSSLTAEEKDILFKASKNIKE